MIFASLLHTLTSPWSVLTSTLLWVMIIIFDLAPTRAASSPAPDCSPGNEFVAINNQEHSDSKIAMNRNTVHPPRGPTAQCKYFIHP